MLLRRLAYAIEEEPMLREVWLSLTFPEEQYNIARLSDFWLNCTDALSDLLESTGQHVNKAGGRKRRGRRRRERFGGRAPLRTGRCKRRVRASPVSAGGGIGRDRELPGRGPPGTRPTPRPCNSLTRTFCSTRCREPRRSEARLQSPARSCAGGISLFPFRFSRNSTYRRHAKADPIGYATTRQYAWSSPSVGNRFRS
jgi:hypothetical protein